MTVETLTTFSGPYVGTGAANQEFPVTFQSAGVDEIEVLLEGLVVDPSLWSFDRDEDGRGTVTATLAGEVYIQSTPSFAQEADFQRFGPYFPDDINPPLDRAAIRDLYLNERLGRSPVAPRDGSWNGMFAAVDAGGNWVAAGGTGADGALRADLAALTGSALLGYRPPGAGAKTFTQKEHNDLAPIYAAAWRNGGRTDLQILTAAFAAWQVRGGGTLELELGQVYDLGTVSTESSVFILASGLRNATLEGNGATITIKTVKDDDEEAHLSNILYLFNYEGVTIRNLHGVDTMTEDWTGRTGARLVVLDSDASHPSLDITLDNVTTYRMTAMLATNPGVPSNRISGINICPNCRAERTFYGINCQGNGDNLTADFTAKNGNRAYFPYGVRGHRVRVRVENEVGPDYGANAACLIKAIANTTTQNIELDVTFVGTLVDFNHLVALEFDGANAVISDIDVRVHVEEGTDDPDDAVTFLLRDFTGEGVQPTTSNVWRNIRLSGTCAPGDGENILFETVPLTRTVVALDQGLASGYMNGEIVAPNVALKTAFDSEFYLRTGDLTSEIVTADFSTWPDGPVDIKVTSMCYGSLVTPTDVSCLVYTIHGSVASGAFSYVSSTAGLSGQSWSRGTVASLDFDAVDDKLSILTTTVEYDNADSFAKVTFEYLGLMGSH